MQQETSPLRLILSELRNSLNFHLSTEMSVVPGLLFQAQAFVEASAATAQTRRERAELALLAAQAAAGSQDTGFIAACLRLLLGLGGFGIKLCAGYFDKKTLPPRYAATVLNQLNPLERLLLAAGSLARPGRGEPEIMRLMFECIDELPRNDPEDALLMLEKLAALGFEAPYAVQNELMRGPFGVWLDNLLKLELNEEQVLYLAKTLGLIDAPELNRKLAGKLAKLTEQGKLTVLGSLNIQSLLEDASGLKFLRKPTKEDSPRVAAKALECLAELGAPDLARDYCAWPEQGPLRLLTLASFSRRDLHVWLREEKPAERSRLLLGFIGLLARCEAGWLKQAGAGAALAAPFDRYMAALGTLPEELKPRPLAKLQPLVSQPRQSEGSWLDRLKGLAGLKNGKPQEPKAEENFLQRAVAGGAVSGQSLANQRIEGLRLGRFKLEKVELFNLGLAGSELKQVSFTGCRLRGIDFSRARLAKLEFEDCEFSQCQFDEAGFTDCVFKSCKFLGCGFLGVSISATLFFCCELRECDFLSALIRGLKMRSSELSACNFEDASLGQSEFTGVDFLDCLFPAALIFDSRFRQSVFRACEFPGLRGYAVTAGDACLAKAMLKARQERLARAAGLGLGEPPQELAGEAGLKQLVKICEQWFFEADLAKRERGFRAANRRRLDWAACKLGQSGIFLKLLPLLLAAPKLRRKEQVHDFISCPITGFTPGYRELLQARHWLAEEPGASGILPVESLFSIGSVGSVAQTPASDLDVWVCLEQLPAQLAPELARKLKFIEDLAQSDFGLVLHFFPMRLQDVRENNFGFSDEESAGSTQAKLLKEEFYRSALWLAGKGPAWWLVPARVGDEVYAAQLARVSQSINAPQSGLVDLGNLSDISRAEFFGASLWQIVKALKNPFKSVMKLALLEKYYLGSAESALICDRVKDNVCKGLGSLWDVDPYAMLLAEVDSFYASRDNLEARGLMRLAFVQKTGFAPGQRTTGRGYETTGTSFAEFFFPPRFPALAAELARIPQSPQGGEAASGFAALIKTGVRLSNFMFATYNTLRSHIFALDEKAVINDEDLTKVGRKLFSAFNQREHKVMRIPFVASPSGMFGAIEFSCDSQASSGVVFTALGEGRQKGSGKLTLEELRRENHPVRLAAWLVANQIYQPGLYLRSQALTAPLTVSDLSGLLRGLYDFFPHHQTFETPPGQSLQSESACRVFLALNLRAAREERRITEVTAVYSTNWGEMFCLECLNSPGLLESDPMGFLRRNLSLEVRPDLELRVYYPAKAQCPRLSMFEV